MPLIIATKASGRFRLEGEKITRWSRFKLWLTGATHVRETPSGNDVYIQRDAIDYMALVPREQVDKVDAEARAMNDEQKAMNERQIAIRKAQMELEEEELKRRGKKVQIAGTIPGLRGR